MQSTQRVQLGLLVEESIVDVVAIVVSFAVIPATALAAAAVMRLLGVRTFAEEIDEMNRIRSVACTLPLASGRGEE
ncbi:MAG: hypothetical protein EXR69_11675, partial [Myxococcales bacterium]|nr:hypothetical protein [Myxococcales bacterium]